MENKKDPQTREENPGILLGKNPVLEALKAEREIDKILLSAAEGDRQVEKILSLAKKRGILVRRVPKEELARLGPEIAHQGVAAFAAEIKYCEISDLLRFAEEKGEDPFLLIADEIEDPHNLGALIRTAECCGVHGVIIPKHRSVGVNATVAKASAGAVAHIKIAKVTNLVSAAEELKEHGLWLYGADGEAKTSLFETDFSGPAAVVIGSEGRGISRLLKEKCDFILKIPMLGKIESLNASVAGALFLYEILKARQKNSAK